MNIHDMRNTMQYPTLSVTYLRGCVQKAIMEDCTGILTFCFPGQQITCDVSKHILPEIVYMEQFGITVTEDGQYFFVQSWEKGLFCFHLPTGELAWHNKRKRAFELVVKDGRAICRFMDQRVEVMGITSGQVVASYPLGEGTLFFPLDDDHYLTGPKRGKYHVLDRDLQVREIVLPSQLDPEGMDHFLLVDAVRCRDGMQISGFEYMQAYYDAQRAKGIRDMDQYRFSRFVPLYLFGTEK